MLLCYSHEDWIGYITVASSPFLPGEKDILAPITFERIRRVLYFFVRDEISSGIFVKPVPSSSVSMVNRFSVQSRRTQMCQAEECLKAL